MIAPGSGPWSTVLAAGQASSFRIALGDVPTWVLAAIALGALVAAILAYRKQADASAKLAEQVNLQRDALKDQRDANAAQGEVLAAELAEMRRRAEAVARQQADAVILNRGSWRGHVPGVRRVSGSPVHMALVINGSARPIRAVACYLQTSTGDGLHPACLTGVIQPLAASQLRGVGGFNIDEEFINDIEENTKVRLLRVGEGAAFVFIYDAQRHQSILTLRFTDDAGLHWEIDNAQHLEQLAERDWSSRAI